MLRCGYMTAHIRFRSNNRMITSPFYGEILKEYNIRFANEGKVQKKEFWREIIVPRIPNYGYHAFLEFIRKFETAAGLEMVPAIGELHTDVNPLVEQNHAITQLKDSAVATREGIARALNIGTDALQEIIDNPMLLSPKERAHLLFFAMKAQDSRIGATAKVRADVRETVKFNKTFSRAAFVGGDET